MALLAFICFLVAAILFTIEAVRSAFSLGNIALALVALGLAFSTWPGGIG